MKKQIILLLFQGIKFGRNKKPLLNSYSLIQYEHILIPLRDANLYISITVYREERNRMQRKNVLNMKWESKGAKRKASKLGQSYEPLLKRDLDSSYNGCRVKKKKKKKKSPEHCNDN